MGQITLKCIQGSPCPVTPIMQLPVTEANMTDGQCRFASEMMFAARRAAKRITDGFGG
jgi:hypothetical protein